MWGQEKSWPFCVAVSKGDPPKETRPMRRAFIREHLCPLATSDERNVWPEEAALRVAVLRRSRRDRRWCFFFGVFSSGEGCRCPDEKHHLCREERSTEMRAAPIILAFFYCCGFFLTYYDL